jgi:hypothetical protein
MKDDKFLVVNDDDVEITYKRRKVSSDETIHGFNPLVVFAIIIISLFCAVTIGKQPQSNQQSPVIINNN